MQFCKGILKTNLPFANKHLYGNTAVSADNLSTVYVDNIKYFRNLQFSDKTVDLKWKYTRPLMVNCISLSAYLYCRFKLMHIIKYYSINSHFCFNNLLAKPN